MFNWLFKKDPLQTPARKLYNAIVLQARDSALYGPEGAPDTVDGRFEMIVTHAIIVLRRLRQQGEAGTHFSQLVFDIMFDDMDAALREMGTGDMSVGKKIRAMGEAFYGRAQAYETALETQNHDQFAQILQRNLFSSDETEASTEETSPAAKALTAHFFAFAQRLDSSTAEGLFDGELPDQP